MAMRVVIVEDANFEEVLVNAILEEVAEDAPWEVLFAAAVVG